MAHWQKSLPNHWIMPLLYSYGQSATHDQTDGTTEVLLCIHSALTGIKMMNIQLVLTRNVLLLSESQIKLSCTGLLIL